MFLHERVSSFAFVSRIVMFGSEDWNTTFVTALSFHLSQFEKVLIPAPTPSDFEDLSVLF